MPLIKSHTITNLQKIQQLLSNSGLPSQDRDELIEAFSRAKDSDLEGVLKLFNEDSSWIGRLSENYKAKRLAFATGNLAAWQDILRNEEKQLKELEE